MHLNLIGLAVLSAVLALQSPAAAQCPNGQCPVPQRVQFAPQYPAVQGILPPPKEWHTGPAELGTRPLVLPLVPVQQCGPQGCFAAPQQFVGPPVQQPRYVLPQAVPVQQSQPKTYPYQDVVVIDGRPTVVTVTGVVEADGPQVSGANERKVGPLLRAMAKSRLTREVMAETGAGRLTARWRVELAIDDLKIAGAAYQAGMTTEMIAAAEAGGDFPWDRFFDLLEIVVQILLKFLFI